MIGGSEKRVLIVNPRSGGGKARIHDLVGQCRARGITSVVLQPGDDLTTVAAAVAHDGADAVGMAGGDGSQAAVAAIAAEHDLPYVCVPAGTRNHFAIDLGIDPHDVVGALDAFVDSSERRIDLVRVNGRVFVNNASMGWYGTIVRSAAYRDAKLRTIIEMMPQLVGTGRGAVRPSLHRPRRGAMVERADPPGVQQPLRARRAADARPPPWNRQGHPRCPRCRPGSTVPRVAGMDHADVHRRLGSSRPAGT